MKKYLKMSDVITGTANYSGSLISDVSGHLAKAYGPEVYAKYIAHAINSHDELVASLEAARAERDVWERRACKEASTAKALLDDMVKISKRGGEWHDEWDAVDALSDVRDIADKWSEE